jgi:hypothetical protein
MTQPHEKCKDCKHCVPAGTVLLRGQDGEMKPLYDHTRINGKTRRTKFDPCMIFKNVLYQHSRKDGCWMQGMEEAA